MVGSWDGGPSVGIFNHNSGTVEVVDGEIWIGQNGNATAGKASGVYNLAGGTVTVNNWVGIAREGGNGTLNVTGGTLTKGGGGNIVVGHGNSTNTGLLNITAGLVNITAGQLWVGENSAGEAKVSLTGELRAPAIQVAVVNTTYGGVLKLEGGTVRTGRIFGGGGNATVEFHGTTVVATGAQGYFVENIDSANIKTGGAIFDTNGFSVSIGAINTGADAPPPQVLTGEGGLTKTGAGTLTLLGAQAYTGGTSITGGKLVTTSASLANGPVTVTGGGLLGVSVIDQEKSYKTSALTLNQGGLEINTDPAGFTIEPVIDVGTLTLTGATGANVVNIVGTGYQVNVPVPLVSYDTLAGTGGMNSLKLGELPVGLKATLVNNTQDKTIDLVVSEIKIPSWRGGISNIWNTTVANWADDLGGFDVEYKNGDAVYFRDGASTYTVQLPGTVTPGAFVAFTNTTNNYTLGGAGKISGSTRILKQNDASVTISTANDFTGGVRIEGGSIIVPTLSNGGAASPIGAASAASGNIVLAGGTLSYSGTTAATTNRGFTVGAVNGGIGVSAAAANLTISGAPAATAGGLVKRGAGTLTLTGSGAIGSSAAARVDAGKLVIDGTANPTQLIT
ncbi:MAG: hypothetical protein EOP85_10015, partial [Verrucomicrobiaceae bacterium]